ncbi:MAG: peptidoglycan-binding protein [Candidatus Eremiobacteraeota bacterium]|jgi:peptidoglycan hydrolase-like protein with peptidoglycan-binding domain|nr:peptidoglycan-binding protein [Candidatus Eremiobacteraeota bacterium]
MTDRIRSSSSTPARKTGSTSRSKSTAPTSPTKTTSRQKQASGQKTDRVQVSKDPGRTQGTLQSKQLVQGLGDNFARPSKSGGAADTSKPLKRGQTSDTVKQMQESLIKAGFGKELGSAGADGKFGPKTEQAVRKFQEKTMGKGRVDGVVGPKTYEALNKGPQAQSNAKKPDAAGAQTDATKPGPSASANPQEHLLGLLDKGTNKNRITKMNPAFAKDLSGMMKELQEKQQFQPRLTSGWRPGQGKSNHNSGSAADFTAANRKPISNDQLKMMREVASKYGLKILDERNGGYNSQWSGAHLHVSRTGR